MMTKDWKRKRQTEGGKGVRKIRKVRNF